MTVKRSGAARSIVTMSSLLATVALFSACTFSPKPAGSAGTGTGAGAGASGGTGGGAGAAGGAPPLPSYDSIRIDPPSATVSVQPGSPAMQAYKAFGTKAGGAEEDITAKVNWSVDRPMLVPTIAGGVATTGDAAGGVVAVRATTATLGASATLVIKFSSTNVATGPGATPALPAAPAQPFGGPADTTRAPQLVYPNDGVLLPPNLNGVEVHYRPGSTSNTLFEISFANANTDVRVYTRCVTLEDGCVYKPDPSVWAQVAETNRGTGSVSVSVRGTDDAGAGVGQSATIKISFSKDDVRGGLYYWTTTLKSILRWDFGSTTQTAAETVVSPADGDGSTCVGCHALSHDGTKMVATLGGQNDGRILLWDVGNKMAMAKPFTQQHSQFESWNAAGTMFVGMYTDNHTNHSGPSNLLLFDGTTALMMGEIDVGGLRADHPDWSRDEQHIVFTSVDTAGSYTDQRPQKSGLAYIERAGAGWSPPMTFVPYVEGKNRYYPAVAPTNDFVVFNESTCPASGSGDDCDADTDPTATLFSMPLPPGSAKPTLLASANAPGVNDGTNTALTNTYAKWSPFIFQLDEMHKVLWATFSSKRRYGLYKDTGNLYIWMFAVDPGAASGAGDPSYAAFCLPFQALDTSNHIAQWTEQAVPIIP
ncbi:MAG TPA: hypothetical protein VHL80_14555 [Polyangia bacterium]|nr:hypothetical protein [Polyangia bacterium]